MPGPGPRVGTTPDGRSAPGLSVGRERPPSGRQRPLRPCSAVSTRPPGGPLRVVVVREAIAPSNTAAPSNSDLPHSQRATRAWAHGAPGSSSLGRTHAQRVYVQAPSCHFRAVVFVARFAAVGSGICCPTPTSVRPSRCPHVATVLPAGGGPSAARAARPLQRRCFNRDPSQATCGLASPG